MTVIDANGAYVPLSFGELKAVVKYKGYFSDQQLLISGKNIAGAKLELKGTKLYVVSAGVG